MEVKCTACELKTKELDLTIKNLRLSLQTAETTLVNLTAELDNRQDAEL